MLLLKKSQESLVKHRLERKNLPKEDPRRATTALLVELRAQYKLKFGLDTTKRWFRALGLFEKCSAKQISHFRQESGRPN